MSADIFHDKNLQHKFSTKGYCVFRLFGSDEVEEVLMRYADFAEEHNANPYGNKFHGTGWLQNPETRIAISRSLVPIIEKATDRVLKNYRIIGSGFLQKEYGEESEVAVHQDWTYVDERKFFSMNLWVALEDIDIRNGAMFVIPYSHRIFSGYLRPAPTYPVPFKEIVSFLSIFKVAVILKKGECICFNNALLHGSFPNLSSSSRLSLVATVLPADANLLHHYSFNQANPEKIAEYVISNESFLKIERGQPPKTFISKEEKQNHYPVFGRIEFLYRFFKIVAADFFRLT